MEEVISFADFWHDLSWAHCLKKKPFILKLIYDTERKKSLRLNILFRQKMLSHLNIDSVPSNGKGESLLSAHY